MQQLQRYLVALTLTASLPLRCAIAQDVSIDKLLSKLPPPEQLGKPPVRQALEHADPAARDPLAKQIVLAELRGDFQQALNLSRKLVEHYPRSSVAASLRGFVAFSLRQFGEAANAFHSAIDLDPKAPSPHFGLALLEGTRRRFAAAIPHLQRFAELAPESPLPFYALSQCAVRIGHKEEARDYATKAANLAPSNPVLWLQLARTEKELGHTDATLAAIKKGAEVSPDSAQLLAVIGYSYINMN
ncbi:MAG TPA: tetratricopeptide repeat protein, partial [Chthoniobacterales bacterium]|nr:tetratricopeptide repeat protein [Chthoniobacterales bacterium]